MIRRRELHNNPKRIMLAVSLGSSLRVTTKFFSSYPSIVAQKNYHYFMKLPSPIILTKGRMCIVYYLKSVVAIYKKLANLLSMHKAKIFVPA